MVKNINEFLLANNLPELNRDMEKKFTMLVKNYDDTKWGKKNPFPAIVMEKEDGVCTLAVNIFGTCMFFSRTGKRLQNCEALEDVLSSFDCLRNTVVCLELCNSSLSLEKISGIVNPNRVEELEPELLEEFEAGRYMAAFDMITLSEFLEGRSDVYFTDRLNSLTCDINGGNLPLCVPANMLVFSQEEMGSFYDTIEQKGGEGVVLCQINAPWIAGYKNHHKTKKVRGVDFDLEVLDVVEGKGKRAGMVGKLIVRYRDGKPLGVDGRFTDETRIAWFKQPELIVGKIVHVHALQLGSKGALRLPKVRAVRMDKFIGDF